MANLIKKYDDIIFIGTDNYTNEDPSVEQIIVARASWFSWMGESETYNDYGIKNHFEHAEDCPADSGEGDCIGCEEYKVRAHNFWNGSNWKTAVLDAETCDTYLSEITDIDEVARYRRALENATNQRDCGTGYTCWEVEGDEEIKIQQSIWQGDWELFTLIVS